MTHPTTDSFRIINISELAAVPPGPVPGRRMNHIPRIPNAALHVEHGRIAWFGPAHLAPARDDLPVLDAAGGCVIPGLIDCHTHTVFAGSRTAEFVQRISGLTYADIARRGGGIRVTVHAVRNASLDDLVTLARPRLLRMLARGVTTVEIKSGYGLTVEDELKMLRAARILADSLPIEIATTWLAAHIVPPEHAHDREAYLREILDDDLLRRLRTERLAEFIDVFCEDGAFSLEESRRVLEAGARHGLIPRIHADQLSNTGAASLAADLRAASADHLEHIDDAGIDAMRAAGVIPVLLPACTLYIATPPAPARRLIDADLPVAIATDFNPGSAMIESLPLTLSLACLLLRMTPTEALVAATANAAAALRRHHRLGAIANGFQADLVVLDTPDVDTWLAHIGPSHARMVIRQGRTVFHAPTGQTAD